jgi:hypothetical protein
MEARQRRLSSCECGRGGLGVSGRRGRTFRVGQKFLAQGAEAEALVEASGLGLFQHFWAAIHPMEPEEAPSLQLE